MGKVNLKSGCQVVLTSIPPGLLDGLPLEDQESILALLHEPALLDGYIGGLAEVTYEDREGYSHCIWVDPRYIALAV